MENIDVTKLDKRLKSVMKREILKAYGFGKKNDRYAQLLNGIKTEGVSDGKYRVQYGLKNGSADYVAEKVSYDNKNWLVTCNGAKVKSVEALQNEHADFKMTKLS